jgi:hypothetical protein
MNKAVGSGFSKLKPKGLGQTMNGCIIPDQERSWVSRRPMKLLEHV